MASKKGLSEAEKRTRMSEIFLSVFTKLYFEYSFQGDFFTFKEIEKIATQQKKIVLQSVKEILQSLVDDGLVRQWISGEAHARFLPTRLGPVCITGRSHLMQRGAGRQRWRSWLRNWLCFRNAMTK